MWAKDENENLILERVQLDFTNSLTKENIDLVEKTTKKNISRNCRDKDCNRFN